MTRKCHLTIAACLGIGGLTGCVSVQERPAVSARPDIAEERSDAGRLAVAMAAADAAFKVQDTKALIRHLRQIDALGGQPDETAPSDPVVQWRELAGLDPLPMRGRALGPAYRSGQLGAGDSERIEQLFLSGKTARIALEGAGRQALRLSVFDAKNKPVCGVRDARDRCQWVPIFTQRYRIEIANPRQRNIRYYLVID